MSHRWPKEAPYEEEKQRLIALQISLKIEANAPLNPSSPADVARHADIASRIDMLPAAILRAEDKVIVLDGELKAEANATRSRLQAHLTEAHRVTLEAATTTLTPYFAGEMHLLAQAVENLPTIKRAQDIIGNLSYLDGPGPELARSVLAKVEAA